MTDPISDLIIRIQNASRAGKESVVLLDSKVAFAVLEKLADRGFIKKPVRKVKDDAKLSKVGLIYKEDKSPRIAGVREIFETFKTPLQRFPRNSSRQTRFRLDDRLDAERHSRRR